jgi:alpha-N-acetylglucosamine transferase
MKTTGAVIFAQNNSSIDYVKLAIFAATQIKTFLNIPVSIITDSADWMLTAYPKESTVFDQIISIENTLTSNQKRFNDGTLSSKFLEWKNLSRNSVYELTPYDRTLVIDSDYIINSSLLSNALFSDHTFQIYKDSVSLSSWRDNTEFTRINQFSIPFYWATTFIFEKTLEVKSFFDIIDYIKSNWQYFRTLYSIEVPTFRNDFAFSIAIHLMNAKTAGMFAQELPGKMLYISDRDLLISIEDKKMKFLIEKENHLGEYTAVSLADTDVHVMNKLSLSRFIDGGLGV